MPFSVWADGLDAYVASRDLTTSPRWDAELAAELAGILPSAGRAPRGRRRAGAAFADERFRAHRAIRALLELLAADQPLVLVLDDLQWADRASAELIARCWASARSTRRCCSRSARAAGSSRSAWPPRWPRRTCGAGARAALRGRGERDAGRGGTDAEAAALYRAEAATRSTSSSSRAAVTAPRGSGDGPRTLPATPPSRRRRRRAGRRARPR